VRVTTPILAAVLPLLVLAGSPGGGSAQEPFEGGGERPSWAAGLPDTVWVLVEASTAAEDDHRSRELLAEAEALARAGAESRPEDVPSRFALAVVLGLKADRNGGRTRVLAAAELREELDAVLELAPDHARAHHMLGRLHAGVRRMNRVVRWIATRLLGGGALDGASWEEAERHLAFAEERAPEVLDHHLQLAKLYRDTGRPGLALEEVEHALALPARSPMEIAVRDEAVGLRDDLEDGGGGRQ
jgi:hypothetical protein